MFRLYKKCIEKLKSYQYRHLNIFLIAFVVGLSILGLNVISSATANTVYAEGALTHETKQFAGIIMGSAAMFVIMLFDYHFVLKFAWLIYAFNLLLLLAVRLIGENNMGAQRWIEVGPIQLQPSEFAKVFIILFFAYFFQKHKSKINSLPIFLLAIVLFAIPIFLILKQPDLSTSLAICFIFAILYYVAGLSYKIIFGIIGAMIPIAVVFLYLVMQPNQKIIEDYQRDRLVAFFDKDSDIAEEKNYQQENAELAIGTGGLWGKGLHNDSEDSVKNGNYIPEPQTDFIFAIVGEELGFVGTSGVILLLGSICFNCIYTGIHAPDLAGRLICVGVATIIAIQTFINICVVTNMMPNTGLTLPFVSYGLSSLLSLYVGMGFVLNVGLQRRKL